MLRIYRSFLEESEIVNIITLVGIILGIQIKYRKERNRQEEKNNNKQHTIKTYNK